MKVITTEKIPIKIWANGIEENAMNQAKNLANLPFAFSHVSLMPDCHSGYGMPIGGVLATIGAVIPNAVGVDIGCGMCAMKTNLKMADISTDIIKDIMSEIRDVIPLGFNHNREKCEHSDMPPAELMIFGGVCDKEYQKAMYQMGTLGGGNHFIEIQKDTDGFIWVMVHCGSRNLGKTVADYYNKKAKELNESFYSEVKANVDLAFIPQGSDLFNQYMTEMKYCVDFALKNRMMIMSKIMNCFTRVVGSVKFDEIINIPHNYAAIENHFGKNVIVHRKGATKASLGTIGIIPGSMGSKSFIVSGLGNKDSFESCSHGAGRRMGRKQAERELNLDYEISNLNKDGIIHSIRTASDLDEAPGAYKNIDEVMESQSDLVSILVELKPIGVIKG